MGWFMLTVASPAGAWVEAWMEWMALAGRQVVAKRRTVAAKRWAVVTTRPVAAQSVVMVATLRPAAGLLPGAILAMAA